MKQMKSKGFMGLEHWKLIALYLLIYDIVTINLSYFIGLWLRFDLQYSKIPSEYLMAFIKFAPFYTVFSIIVFYMMHMYNSLWRFASFNELTSIMMATVVTGTAHVVGITLFVRRMPIAYYVFGICAQFIFTTGIRFGYRFVNLERAKREKTEKSAHVKHHVMVIGAGAAGMTVLRELHNSRELTSRACCVIDDNPNKWNRFIEGTPIVGGRDTILENVEKYDIDTIMLTMPSASAKDKRDILNICKETNCELKSLPGIYQLANGEVLLSKMKSVAIEDLLGRDQIKVDMAEIFKQLKGKTILVTGGGGSIGSELCRQIAAHEPKQLIIFDVYENNAYEIEQELRRKYKDRLNLVVLIGSVRDTRRIDMVFEKFRPDIVYHAAAHKHVPLMETSPNEAIKNNVVGTYKTAYAALKYGAQKFVLISTDKAVNPTNIMGASKRLCEMVIQSMDVISRTGKNNLLPLLHAHRDVDDPMDRADVGVGNDVQENTVSKAKNRTQFVAVRFGNVLGSNGSVIPLFKKQIEAGGPVTVTHPDIVRYFMTIPEAVSLVLQAGTYAAGGEIFVLDMGEPVKIDSLARNLIKLSGFEPDVDIKISYSGLRLVRSFTRRSLWQRKVLRKQIMT